MAPGVLQPIIEPRKRQIREKNASGVWSGNANLLIGTDESWADPFAMPENDRVLR